MNCSRHGLFRMKHAHEANSAKADLIGRGWHHFPSKMVFFSHCDVFPTKGCNSQKIYVFFTNLDVFYKKLMLFSENIMFFPENRCFLNKILCFCHKMSCFFQNIMSFPENIMHFFSQNHVFFKKTLCNFQNILMLFVKKQYVFFRFLSKHSSGWWDLEPVQILWKKHELCSKNIHEYDPKKTWFSENNIKIIWK